MLSRRNANRWALVLGAGLVLSNALAHADDREVLKRLKSYGDLSDADAHMLMQKVSERMRLAADPTGADDPLRIVVTTALYDSASPNDPAATSMVRLRLYAGLTEWALEHVFSSRRAVSEICGDSGLEPGDCRSLLAAGQSVPFEETSPIRVRGSETRAVAASDASPSLNVRWPRRVGAVDAHADGNATGAMKTSAAPRRVITSGGDAEASSASAPIATTFPRRVAPSSAVATTQRAQPPAAAAPSRPAAPPAPSRAEVAQRKADYTAQRQAYLERQRREMEARKAKVIANAGGGRAQRGPASEEEAQVVGLSKKSAETGERNPAIATARAPAAPAKARGSSGDSDLFEGLMDDPLGKH